MFTILYCYSPLSLGASRRCSGLLLDQEVNHDDSSRSTSLTVTDVDRSPSQALSALSRRSASSLRAPMASPSEPEALSKQPLGQEPERDTEQDTEAVAEVEAESSSTPPSQKSLPRLAVFKDKVLAEAKQKWQASEANTNTMAARNRPRTGLAKEDHAHEEQAMWNQIVIDLKKCKAIRDKAAEVSQKIIELNESIGKCQWAFLLVSLSFGLQLFQFIGHIVFPNDHTSTLNFSPCKELCPCGIDFLLSSKYTHPYHTCQYILARDIDAELFRPLGIRLIVSTTLFQKKVVIYTRSYILIPL